MLISKISVEPTEKSYQADKINYDWFDYIPHINYRAIHLIFRIP